MSETAKSAPASEPSEDNLADMLRAYGTRPMVIHGRRRRDRSTRGRDFLDLPPETVEAMRVDVERFARAHASAIESWPTDSARGFGDCWSAAGHDLWLNRNGHGCGFWDGDWREPAATS